jgi:hypothetical protein
MTRFIEARIPAAVWQHCNAVEGGYRPAAICRRGHVASTDTELSPELASNRCGECGAEIIRSCPECDHFIRGRYRVPGVIGFGGEYKPPDFCEDCGAPFPWLSRQGRIYLLQDMLDSEELDPADKLEAAEQLQALTNPDLDVEEQLQRWERFKHAAPALWERSGAQRILESVVSASIKAGLGL